MEIKTNMEKLNDLLETTACPAPVTLLLRTNGINWMHTTAFTLNGDGTGSVAKSGRHHKFDGSQGPAPWQRLCAAAEFRTCNRRGWSGATSVSVAEDGTMTSHGEVLDPAEYEPSNPFGNAVVTCAQTRGTHAIIYTGNQRHVVELA